jgi:hypothetical protein
VTSSSTPGRKRMKLAATVSDWVGLVAFPTGLLYYFLTGNLDVLVVGTIIFVLSTRYEVSRMNRQAAEILALATSAHTIAQNAYQAAQDAQSAATSATLAANKAALIATKNGTQ